MGFPNFSVRRPISILMLFIGMVLFGIVSLSRLPVELMPNASYNKITILVNIRGGMPPEDVEFLVTKPIEEAISTVSNLDSLGSTSKEGKATIVLSFQPGLDMDFAALEVREKFSKVKNKLPRSAEKPVIAKYEESDVPVMILAVTGLNHTIEQVRKIVEERIKERLTRIYGVANIEIGGGRERKILVEVNQHRAQAINMPLQRIVSSISRNNLNLMVGNVDKDNFRFLIRTIGQYPTIESINNIHIAKTKENSIIRLKDVADVKDSFLEAKTHSRTNTKDVVSLYIQKESTGNTISVCEKIQAEVDRITQTLEKNIRVITVSNQSIFIQEAISTVKSSLMLGGVLSIIVLFLFLRDVRSTFTIGLSIPLSVVITFSLMYFSDLTINVQSLSGLALGIGMLVDNSIVVLENIFVKKSEGQNSIDAAINGSEEMLMAIVTSTATTILIFIPIIFFTNEQMKILYGPIAFTVTFSLVSSLLVALSVIPMLNARGKEVIKAVAKKAKKGIMYTFQKGYRKMLMFVIRYRYVVVPVTFFILYLSGVALSHLDKELLASSEQGKFTIFVELPSGAKLELSDKVVKDVELILAEIPEIKTFSSRVEGWSSKVYVDLVQPEFREKTVEDVIEELRPQVKSIGEAERAFIYFSESRGGGSREVLIDVYGFDYKILKKLATEIAGKIESQEGFKDLKLRMKEGRPEMLLMVDKQDAAKNGVTTREIADELHAQVRGLEATRFHSQSKEIDTITRLQQKDRAHLSDIRELTLVNSKGIIIPLKAVVDFKEGIGPSEIWRLNKSRMIQVSSNLHKISMEKAVEILKVAFEDIDFPKDYYYLFGGDYSKQIENERQLIVAFYISMALVYMILAALFESYFQPIIIMIAIPLSAIGVAIGLASTATTISMGVMIGAIMLGGIAVNNSIVLMDHTNHLMHVKKYGPVRAIVMAGMDRLRPILMTTATTVLGLIPMAMDKSQGASLWSPLAITVICGMLSSTPMTLFLVPSLFTIFNDVAQLYKRIFHVEDSLPITEESLS